MIPTHPLRTARTCFRASYQSMLSPRVLSARQDTQCRQTPSSYASPRGAASFATTTRFRASTHAAARSPTTTTRHDPTADLQQTAAKPKTSPALIQYPINHQAANPPSTTLPPPLNLPRRQPDQSTPSFYFATGKAYLTFYKTGLKNIYTNIRLVWALDKHITPTPSPSDSSPSHLPKIDPSTRAAFLLRHRSAHDLRRLPLFALILLICGEFTPFVVLAFPSLVPFPCRIPRQLEGLQKKALARREASFAALEKSLLQQQQQQQRNNNNNNTTSSSAAAAAPLVIAHIARAHNLISPLWDRLPDPLVTSAFSRRAVLAHARFLMRDDALLRQAGGHAAIARLEEKELACAQRGLLLLEDVAQREDRLAANPEEAGPKESDTKEETKKMEKAWVLGRRLALWGRDLPGGDCRVVDDDGGGGGLSEEEKEARGRVLASYVFRLANRTDDRAGHMPGASKVRGSNRPHLVSPDMARMATQRLLGMV